MSNPVTARPSANNQPAAVIRRVQGAQETATQRLLKKHIPAWVISGAVHIALIMTLILLDLYVWPKAAAQEKSETEITVVNEEQPPEESTKNLTNPDEGLDADLPAAVESDVVMDQNVEKEIVKDLDPGVNDAVAATPVNVTAPPGTEVTATNSGLTSDAIGEFASGITGGGLSRDAAASFLGRTGASRNNLVKSGGGNDKSEAAVGKGLEWLAKMQKKDGSWQFDGTSASDRIAATGMCVLPFLAAGQTHKPFKDNKYQKTVEAAVGYLIANLQPTGTFKGSSGMYAHAIATVALCELLGMTGDKNRLLGPTQLAVNYIVKAQGSNGSWGYGPNANGDTSIVGWQIQALHSAKLCKELKVPKETFENARKFLDSVSGPKKETYGYADRSPSLTLTPVGLLCRYYADGWGPSNQGMSAGVAYLMKSLQPTAKNFNMYYFYYATQVVHFYDGPEWLLWNSGDPADKANKPGMRDLLIGKQVVDGKDKTGSWDPDASMIGSSCGRVGTTALCLLTLEVYYRHLPLYKRDTAGMRELDKLR